jgi:hypothetical protein
MIGNEDLRLVAEGLIVAHGPHAARHCETIIAQMIEKGDKAGEENWTGVLAALHELQRPG